MKGQNRVFWLCLTGTILLALGIIFLPRYFSRSLDMSSIGQVEVTGRDGFSFLEAGSNDIPGVARAFRYLEKNGENPILISSLEEPSQIDRELTEKVYYEANSTAKLGMVPWLGIELEDQSANDWKTGLYKDWSECVKFARYYSLTYESLENSNKKELKRQKRRKKEEKRNAARLYSHTQGVSFRVAGKFAKVFAAFGITHLARCSQGGNKAQLL